MAYSWCRFTIARDTLERYAGALDIYSKTQRESAAEQENACVKLETTLDARFAAGASAALRTIVQLDGEVDPESFAVMVMSRNGGGE